MAKAATPPHVLARPGRPRRGDGDARCLQRAGATPHSVGYINLHGTGTQANDLAEDKAVCTLFGRNTPCSSTKGWTGHTLGAAGIVEAVFALLCLRDGFLPAQPQYAGQGPEHRRRHPARVAAAAAAAVISNSFGFGGSNCSLVFGMAA